jgi:hypothetical protein
MFYRKKDDLSQIGKKGIVAGLLELLYVVLMAAFLLSAPILFPITARSFILGPIIFLLATVFSVAFSGILVFGLPAYYFLNKKYREAGVVLASTLGVLLAAGALIILGEIFIF